MQGNCSCLICSCLICSFVLCIKEGRDLIQKSLDIVQEIRGIVMYPTDNLHVDHSFDPTYVSFVLCEMYEIFSQAKSN